MAGNAGKIVVLYVNNTGCDLTPWHAEIAAALGRDGTLPEELADLFEVKVGAVNSDGTPRYVINAR